MRRALPFVFAACLAVTLAPIWIARHVPAVDVPQHLFLAEVLRGLGDPASHHHAIYVAAPKLTYVTFYYFVKAAADLVGVEAATKLWLSLVLGAIPLSLLVLLRTLRRDEWLSLLAFPLVYTDNFYWGLVSFLSSIPLTFLVCALFVRVLEAERQGLRWAAALAFSLVALQLTHAAAMIFPAAALPLLLVLTPSDRRRRARALAALVPGVALFLAWLVEGVHRDRVFGEPGEPWKAVAPLLDARSFEFTAGRVRLAQWFELLGNGFWDWADRRPLWLLAGLVLLLAAASLLRAPRAPAGLSRSELRPFALFALALAAYFLLPTHVTGYMYMVHPRYAQVSALLLLPALAFPAGRGRALAATAAAAIVLYAGLNLSVLFHRFDAEARDFDRVVASLPERSRVMHLVLDRGSAVATHAVYLHYAALAAQRVNGTPSFSLALDPSFPVNYRAGARPPGPAWEWRPERFSWDQASWYDHYLVRGGASAQELFGSHAAEVEPVAAAGRWRVLRRVTGGELAGPPDGPVPLPENLDGL